MNIKYLALLLSTIFIILTGISTSALADNQKNIFAMASLVKGNNIFAVNLYKEMGAYQANLFFSPYSISTALAMTYAGAKGNTAKEIAQALNFGIDRNTLPFAFKNLSQAMKTHILSSGQILNIANGLYLSGGDIAQDFQNLLGEIERCCRSIDSWTELRELI